MHTISFTIKLQVTRTCSFIMKQLPELSLCNFIFEVMLVKTRLFYRCLQQCNNNTSAIHFWELSARKNHEVLTSPSNKQVHLSLYLSYNTGVARNWNWIKTCCMPFKALKPNDEYFLTQIQTSVCSLPLTISLHNIFNDACIIKC